MSHEATELAGAIEAILLQAGEPVPAADLARALDAGEDTVLSVLAQLAAFYDETGRGFELRQVAGGWRYYTRVAHADAVAAWVVDGQQARLSQAALETLAIVAYTQPVPRGRISAIRGVNVDGVVRTLVLRDLIAEVGRDEVTGAALFGTTASFLERLGLNSLDELPPIAPHLPDASLLEAELAHLAEPAGASESATVVPVSPDAAPVADSPPAGERPSTD
jgi:segregation and condensation protein B